MNKILNIARKEVRVNFQSPVSYILMCLSLIIFNTFFFIIIDENREATLRDIFILMEFMFVFIVPLFTMRSIAQEHETGTMEFLMTTPTTNTQIILGKYIGNILFFTVIVALTSPYYFIIEHFGEPDRLSVLVGYGGIWLEGAFFIAIGLMTSSWTKSQVLAAMSSYIIILALYFSVALSKYTSGLLATCIDYLNIMTHTQNFFAGIVNTSDLIYFMSGILVCILFTRISIENRLWR